MIENQILKRIAELANVSLEFKNERILTGTAWIDGMPIDITVTSHGVRLNGIGAFSGDAKTLAKSEWRGKGKFRALVPYIKQTLIEFGFELYLTPMSPVCKKNYNLVQDENCRWKIIL